MRHALRSQLGQTDAARGSSVQWRGRRRCPMSCTGEDVSWASRVGPAIRSSRALRSSLPGSARSRCHSPSLGPLGLRYQACRRCRRLWSRHRQQMTAQDPGLRDPGPCCALMRSRAVQRPTVVGVTPIPRSRPRGVSSGQMSGTTNDSPQHSEAHPTWALITLTTRRLTRGGKPRTDTWDRKDRPRPRPWGQPGTSS